MADNCEVVSQTASAPQELEDELHRYSTWLAQAEPPSDFLNKFRAHWPRRYLELCQLHLSVLVDLPVDFLLPRLQQLSKNAIATKSADLTSCDSYTETPTPTRGVHLKWPTLHFPYRSTESTTRLEQTTIGRKKSGTPNELPETVVRNLLYLMDYLDKKEYLIVEGIFRKTGSVARQRTLRHYVTQSTKLNLDEIMESTEEKPTRPAGRCAMTRKTAVQTSPSIVQIGIHDLFSALKGVLYDLSEPLLSLELLPIFSQVAALTEGRANENGHRVVLRPAEQAIAKGKQLKALRLLCLLMPVPNTKLLKRLLVLLQHTLEHSSVNRMTVESLGTIFAPLLFSPGKVCTRQQHTNYTGLAKLASLMISQGTEGLWSIPVGLVHDVQRNQRWLHQHTGFVPKGTLGHFDDNSNSSSWSVTTHSSTDSASSWPSECNLAIMEQRVGETDTDSGYAIPTDASEDMELPPLVTGITFASTSSNTPKSQGRDTGWKNRVGVNTEYAVAELYAAVQALPQNDPRKRRLLQRFNAANGGLTPSERYFNVQVTDDQWELDQPPPLGPTGPLGFSRHALSSCAATRASKTIRSSLRYRLGIRVNPSVGQVKTPTMSKSSRSATPVRSLNPLPSWTEQASSEGESIVSPTFGATELIEVPSPDATSLQNIYHHLPPTSGSRSSFSGDTVQDVVLCCPFAEVLTTPFRQRVAYKYKGTPSSSARKRTKRTPNLSWRGKRNKRFTRATKETPQYPLVWNTFLEQGGQSSPTEEVDTEELIGKKVTRKPSYYAIPAPTSLESLRFSSLQPPSTTKVVEWSLHNALKLNEPVKVSSTRSGSRTGLRRSQSWMAPKDLYTPEELEETRTMRSLLSPFKS